MPSGSFVCPAARLVNADCSRRDALCSAATRQCCDSVGFAHSRTRNGARNRRTAPVITASTRNTTRYAASRCAANAARSVAGEQTDGDRTALDRLVQHVGQRTRGRSDATRTALRPCPPRRSRRRSIATAKSTRWPPPANRGPRRTGPSPGSAASPCPVRRQRAWSSRGSPAWRAIVTLAASARNASGRNGQARSAERCSRGRCG